MQKLNAEFDGKESADYIISSGGISEGAMIVVQSKADPTIRTVGTIQENGSINWIDKFKRTEPAESQGLAKDILTVTVSGDTVTSPYYVNYPSAKGTIKCRVLYNDDTYGLQLVSLKPVTTVKLGKNDTNPNVKGGMGSAERAQNSYMRAITTLNEKAEEYKGTADGSILAIDTRCIGSDPLNKNYPDNLTGDARTAEMFIADSSYTYMNNFNGKYFKADLHYQTDMARLSKIGALNTGNKYWLASRDQPYVYNGLMIFPLRGVPKSGELTNSGLWAVSVDGMAMGANADFYFRPVFKLSSNVKILGGEGTEAVPYEIGI